MRKDVLDRLRKLGVQKGARDLIVPPRRPVTQPVADDDDEARRPVEKLLPGSQLVENEFGSYLVRDRVYPLTHRHGSGRLGSLRNLSAAPMATYLGEVRLQPASFAGALFLDTETTGLWGVGTIAFMVGIGFFDGDAFTVRQYFCRDHGDEAAMLLALDQMAARRDFLVTFNGRTFDVPLLETRYVMNRQLAGWIDAPQLDLLHPARRLWRRRLGSVALSALEEKLLDVRRTVEDVPGALIPRLYHDYLRRGDGRELVRVFYHNEIDILSMVTLAERVLHMVDDGPTEGPGDDLLSLALWQLRIGDAGAAEATLRQARAEAEELETFHAVSLELALLLKRADRIEEAVPLWQQVAVTATADVTAHEELAKYYEWRCRDCGAALRWVAEAEQLAARSGLASARREELAHRRRRLERKSA